MLGSNYNKNKNANKVIESINRIEFSISIEVQVHVLGDLHDYCAFPQVRTLPPGANDEQISDFLGECDVFVYSSPADTFPSILIEAQAMGVAVVACDIGGVTETFEDAISGLSVKNLNGELEKTLIGLLNNPDKIEEMKKSAQKIASKYSYKSIGEKHRELYQELVSRDQLSEK